MIWKKRPIEKELAALSSNKATYIQIVDTTTSSAVQAIKNKIDDIVSGNNNKTLIIKVDTSAYTYGAFAHIANANYCSFFIIGYGTTEPIYLYRTNGTWSR